MSHFDINEDVLLTEVLNRGGGRTPGKELNWQCTRKGKDMVSFRKWVCTYQTL